MVKKLIHILSAVFIVLFFVSMVFFYSIYYTVDHVQIHNKTIQHNQIPASMDNLKIAYFSDIKFNAFMNEERLHNIFDEFNKYDSDIIIFGGDLFTYFHNQKPSKEAVKQLTELLSSLEAPYGKFAVLGDEDMKDKEATKLAKKVLFDSNFEVLSNKPLQLRNGGTDSISLIGIDPMINGKPNVQKALKNISEKAFTIMVTHCPDLLTNEDINTNYLDLVLSAHSLGGQIKFPIIGSLRKIDGAREYVSGNYTINNTYLNISNGLGTVDVDMRLFARPEIEIFHLKHSD